MSVKVIKQYTSKLDSKRRMTIKSPHYEHYEVNIFADGHILLKPKVLVDTNAISVKTLNMIRKSAVNFKKGKVSKTVNIEKYIESSGIND